MSLGSLWRFLAVALPVLASLIASLASVDLTYHLRAGNEILATGSIPATDTWTFTAAGAPWFDQQWGAQVILALVERLGGWAGLAIARALMVGFVFGTLALIVRRRGVVDRTAALLVLGAFVVAAPSLALRPELLGLGCFATVLLLVTDRRDHPGRLWAIPVVVAVWANLHGSFVLGPVVVGLAWLEDLHDKVTGSRRTLIVSLVTALAACLTPFGPGVWGYALGLSMNPEVTSRITEWQPTSLRDVPGVLFFGSVVGVVALLARRALATPWPTLLWLLVFFLLGAYAIRGVAWWPLAAVVGLSGLLASPVADRSTQRVEPPLGRRINLAVAAMLVAVSLVVLPVWRPLDPGLGTPDGLVSHAPSGMTAALTRLSAPGDRVFNPQRWGSWFEYRVPEVLVAIDSRIELFPAQVWRDYESVLAGSDGWAERMGAWQVNLVVTDRPESSLGDRLLTSGWTEAYVDTDGAIYAAPGSALRSSMAVDE
jgi:hypothetical protein